MLPHSLGVGAVVGVELFFCLQLKLSVVTCVSKIDICKLEARSQRFYTLLLVK